jgi:hypothetical protein
MLALLLVALSLGLSNFAASVGIGVSGIDSRARLRVGVIFGIFETGMPTLGLLLGRSRPGADALGLAPSIRDGCIDPTALAARVVPVRVDSGWTNVWVGLTVNGLAPW